MKTKSKGKDAVPCLPNKSIGRTPITLETKVVSMLQKGDRVIIYDDPVTKQRPEGTAILKKRLGDQDGEFQYWLVRFEGEDRDLGRFIYSPWEVVVS